MLTSILIVEGLFYFFLQKFVKLMDEIINILDTSDECLPGIFLVNIRPSNVQKEFSVLAFFLCVQFFDDGLSKLCEIFGDKKVVLVIFEVFLLHKDLVFYLPVTNSAYQLSFTVVYRPNNVAAINTVFSSRLCETKFVIYYVDDQPICLLPI